MPDPTSPDQTGVGVDLREAYQNFKAHPDSVDAAWQRWECGEAAWPGDNALLIADYQRLRAELDALHVRLQQTEAVVQAARAIEAIDHGVGWPDLAHAIHALDQASPVGPSPATTTPRTEQLENALDRLDDPRRRRGSVL